MTDYVFELYHDRGRRPLGLNVDLAGLYAAFGDGSLYPLGDVVEAVVYGSADLYDSLHLC
jgi:hypothetical protein